MSTTNVTTDTPTPTDLTEFEVFGVCFFSTATAFCLLHFRILWVLSANGLYRSRECYRLLTQATIAQVLTGPGYMLLGLSRLFSFEPWRLPINLFISATRVEVFLTFVLALNRLKIIADLKYPNFMHTILAALGWIIGCTHFIVFVSPCCKYLARPFHYTITFDDSYPGSLLMKSIGSAYLLSMNALTLSVYLVFVAYIINLKLHSQPNTTSSSLARLWRERSILLYAFVRFLCDSTLTVFYYYGAPVLPTFLWIEIPLIYLHQIDKLLLPPLLFLMMCRSVRNEVFPFLKPRAKVVAVIV
ncbi:hypothetical protein QR680_015984 [Steinernema hermaphroditum]|uniref:Uncharacterized protein n=1 Tax=Steinernema hermaphroditum TaxID=289476 RepID=A0AA39LLP1_9BILA|nr:hypothetical protein QR680_015984 [Steinernema hermaphroditum]